MISKLKALKAPIADSILIKDQSVNIKDDDIQDLNFYYGSKQALSDVTLPIHEKQVTALIGPSGCGKSTFLRTLNRMSDIIPGTCIEGRAIFDGINIYDQYTDEALLRQRIGLLFQRPNPFPKSIFENVAYGLKVQGKKPKQYITEVVEQSLRSAALWDEVKDRLHDFRTGSLRRTATAFMYCACPGRQT